MWNLQGNWCKRTLKMAGSIILLLITGLPEQKEHLKISFKHCCEWERLLNQWKYCKYWLCTEEASSPELLSLVAKGTLPSMMVSDSREYVQYIFIYFCFWCECMCVRTCPCGCLFVRVCESWSRRAVEPGLFPVAAEALQWHPLLLLYANVITG